MTRATCGVLLLAGLALLMAVTGCQGPLNGNAEAELRRQGFRMIQVTAVDSWSCGSNQPGQATTFIATSPEGNYTSGVLCPDGSIRPGSSSAAKQP